MKSYINIFKKKLTSKFDYIPERSEKKNFKNLKSDLVECAKYENTLNKHNLKFHIHHGELFDEFHGCWIQERAKENVTLNWNDWLQDNNFGSERNVGRKRELARFIKPFPRLQCVNTSLNKFHHQKKDIEAMFAAHPHLKPFWESEESTTTITVNTRNEESSGDEALLEEMKGGSAG